MAPATATTITYQRIAVMPTAANPSLVVLVHDAEMFLFRRINDTPDFPGYDVFPRVVMPAAQDGFETGKSGVSRAHPLSMPELIKMLGDDFGFYLKTSTDRHAIRAVSYIEMPSTGSHAPPARYYFIYLTERPDLPLNSEEMASSQWISPATALEHYRAGELLLAPETLAGIIQLEKNLGGFRKDAEFPVAPGYSQNEIEYIHAVRHIEVASCTLPPASRTNCLVIGDSGCPHIAIDPSPKNRDELRILEGKLKALHVDRIFLTHHHPDHRQYADELARRNRWPMLMSRDTSERLLAIDPDYFTDIKLEIAADGDAITHWLGHPVRVLAVPGHDAGQLALMPDNAAWCLVGDLIQGIGTVVIAEPEGHMASYYASLERIIGLSPKIIYPSHGIPMRTTFRLEQTLLHRRHREAQILERYRSGMRIEAILDDIYRGTDARLIPYARKNIESHLRKLREEGAVSRPV